MNELRMIRKSHPAWPDKLRPYPGMPHVLYVRGDLPDPQRKSVAIVGARSCSTYGRKAAMLYASTLASHGVQIISGLAIGIDGYAHRGALEAGGRTFAVLGCGAEKCYPPSHASLYERILENGGVLSEYEPGTPAMPHHFPARNRIISALADVVLVIEARRKSGSLITAMHALEQGKIVYALPGRATDGLSEGCNMLLADGAGVAWCPEAILQELGLGQTKKEDDDASSEELPEPWRSDPVYQAVWNALTQDPKGRDQLLHESGLGPAKLAEILMRLCIQGFVEELPGQTFQRA